MDQIVQLFKALGDETRLKILLILSRRKICAKGIARHLGISEAAVSQHIKILKESGIIIGEKVGYYVHYDLQEAIFTQAIDFINQIKQHHTMVIDQLDFHIPHECSASCKTNQNKCCQRKYIQKSKGEGI